MRRKEGNAEALKLYVDCEAQMKCSRLGISTRNCREAIMYEQEKGYK